MCFQTCLCSRLPSVSMSETVTCKPIFVQRDVRQAMLNFRYEVCNIRSLAAGNARFCWHSSIECVICFPSFSPRQQSQLKLLYANR